jgi:hypothetical protein
MQERVDDWDQAREKYVTQFTQYHAWLGELFDRHYAENLDKLSRDGMTGRVVGRAIWDLENLTNWMDAPLPLAAYCIRSLLELATILWSVERTGDWRRWYGFAAKDLFDCVRKAARQDPDHEGEGLKLVEGLRQAYEQAGVEVPEETESTFTEAENGGYSSEYDEAFKLLSKFVHPTPLMLFAPVSVCNNDVFRRYFLMKSLKYLRTIYCLAAEQSGYNPSGIDIAEQLAQLRAELT